MIVLYLFIGCSLICLSLNSFLQLFNSRVQILNSKIQKWINVADNFTKLKSEARLVKRLYFGVKAFFVLSVIFFILFIIMELV